MFMEMIHKTIDPLLFLSTLMTKNPLIREEPESMEDDEVPGDNFPHAVMFRKV